MRKISLVNLNIFMEQFIQPWERNQIEVLRDNSGTGGIMRK